MTTPFFFGFARALLVDLVKRERVEVAPGAFDRVVLYVAGYLAEVREGGSAVSSVVRALLACPDVEEVYADDAEIKLAIQELEGTPAQWVHG